MLMQFKTEWYNDVSDFALCVDFLKTLGWRKGLKK